MKRYLAFTCLIFIMPHLQAQFFISVFPIFQVGSENFSGRSSSENREFYLNYINDPHLLDLGLDYSSTHYDLFLRVDLFKSFYGATTGAGYSNLFISSDGFNTAGFNSEFPSLGYFGYHNDKLDLSLGRRRYGVGPGKYSLMLGSQNPAMDGFWFYFSPFDQKKVRPYGLFFAAASDTRANQVFIRHNQRYWDAEAGQWVEDVASGTEPEAIEKRYRNNNKLYFLHKVGISTDRFRISLSESYVQYGDDISLWSFNPFIVWHNNYLSNTNAMGAIDFEVAIKDDIRLYGEFVSDDIVIGEFDIDKPTALAAMIGVEWQVFSAKKPYIADDYGDESKAKKEKTFAKNDGLVLGFETVWTSRYMYERGNADPFGRVTFFNNHQYGQLDEKDEWPIFEYYLGFPYGGASTLIELRAVYKEDRWHVKSTLGYLIQGKKEGTGIYWNTDGFKPQDPIPEHDDGRQPWYSYGDVMHSLLITTTAFYAIKPYLQAYTSVNAKLRMDQFSESTTRFGLGINYKIKSNWF